MSSKPSDIERSLQTVSSPWRINNPKSVDMVQGQFLPPNGDSTGSSADFRSKLEQTRGLLKPLQKKLYAGKQFSVLMIFQALDAAGKDGAIREVFEGLDVGGIRVASFKQPSRLELAHDFLWRTNKELPERGVITAFNRSYYEEVLTVRVHPEFLNAQYAGNSPDPDALWSARYRAIRELENHLAMSNTLVLKFWLDVSPQRQAMRFLDRLEDEKRRWKFSENDIVESGFRSSYDEAVKQMLGETSSTFAPWFCVPADNRWYLRWQIADVLLQALQALPLRYPDAESMNAEKRNSLSEMLRARAAEPFT